MSYFEDQMLAQSSSLQNHDQFRDQGLADLLYMCMLDQSQSCLDQELDQNKKNWYSSDDMEDVQQYFMDIMENC